MLPPTSSSTPPPERHPGDTERCGSAVSTDTTQTETVHDVDDVEKALSIDAICTSRGTSGQPTGPSPDPGLTAGPIMSRAASSARSRAATIVLRSQRRGLLCQFAVIPEAEQPYKYPNSTKWLITGTVALATLAAPLGSSIFYPALQVLTAEFSAPSTVTNLAIALYILSMGIFPLWWSSFSEEHGRRSIFIISFALFIIFAILCAVSQDMTMLIIFRCLSGGASASVQAVGAGTIADIWESYERGRAMGMFYLGPLLGPIVAPIIGGVLAQTLGWRACMYFLSIYGLVVTVLLVLFLPETLARRKRQDHPTASATAPAPAQQLQPIPARQSAKSHKRRLARGMHRFLVEPLGVVLFLRFPPVLVTVLLAAMAFAAMFVANICIQQQFSRPPYQFSEITVGFLYFPSGIGFFLASFFGGRWHDNIMAREARRANRYNDKGKLVLLPEDRMRENMWIANTVYPCGLLLFGWTLNYGVFWFVPCLGAFLFGISAMMVMSTSMTMLTEFVRKRSSAGVAVNNLVRNCLTCVGIVFTSPWVDGIGVGYVMTTVACFCLVAGHLAIWTLRRKAPVWRTGMDQALQQVRE